MRLLSPLLASAALMTFVSLAPATAAMTSTTIDLHAQNGSGEDGTAKLSDTDGGVNVTISLKGAPATAQPVHIHDGTCDKLGGVAYPLTNVVNGSSTTLVKGTTVAALMAKPFAINAHKSASDLGTYVSCGNIVASSSSM
ncbi:MAG TPA: CHRD domain-containing protein [Candidatus Cybelea sp.]|jgi:hypothetical protein|nr:CHRD domain-containing protein [Candidatus Cybelea sp.]